jgi:hypothetical protein
MSYVQHLERRSLFSVYYVDPTVTGGANTGSSPADAWTSLAPVNTASFRPGDSLLFRSGTTLNGGLTFGADDGTTTATSSAGVLPVVVNSYGLVTDSTTGATTAVAGAGTFTLSAGSATHGIQAKNTAGFDISHVNVVGAGQANDSFNGIWFDNALAGNVKLPYLRVHDVDVSGFGRWGIALTGSNGKSGFDDARIEYANVHHNTLGGVTAYGVFSASSTAYAHANVYVGHVAAHDNPGYAGSPNHSGSGIVLSDVNHILIERSVAHDNGARNTHNGGPVGIWVWDVNDATIQHNESHHNHTNSTSDGGGFDFDGGVTNSVLQYNYSHDNDGAGYGIYQFSGARPLYHNTVRYNISANDGRKNGYAAIDLWNGSGASNLRDVDIYNNTIYVTPAASGSPRAVRFLSATVDVRLRNNIFQTTGGLTLVDVKSRQTGLLFQGNDYWSSGGTFAIRDGTKTYASVAAWSAKTGRELIGTTAVGKQFDPKFVSPGSVPTLNDADRLESDLGAFKLASTSPLIDGGLNLWSRFAIDPGPRDFFGTALPRTRDAALAFAYDLGAAETA